MKTLLSLIILSVLTITLNAQNAFNVDSKKQSVFLRYGLEPTYVLGVGYWRNFEIPGSEKNFITKIEISSPTNLMSMDNYELKLNNKIPFQILKSLGVVYDLGFSTGHVETRNFSSQKIAVSNKLFVGIYKEKWYLSLFGEYEKILSSKIEHSKYYREYIYPEAVDGWYKSTGGNIQLGIETGFTIYNRLDIGFDLKIPKSEKLNSYNGSPGHINMSVGYRF